jgi:Tfp pilus assembly protein PilF
MNNLRLVKLEEMEKAQPHEPFIKFAIAQEHINAADDVQAKIYFDWLLVNKPVYLPVYYHAGKLYERINAFDRAQEIYRKGIELAKSTGETKTAGELNEALMLIKDE